MHCELAIYVSNGYSMGKRDLPDMYAQAQSAT